MKALLLLAILATTLVGGTAVQAQQPQLRLTLQLEKTQFSASEPIVARILIENLSAIDMIVNSRLLANRPIGPHELFFQIRGPEGKLVPFAARIRDSFDSREFLRLGTQRVIGTLYDLAKEHELKAPGEYTVTAFYENKRDPPPTLKLPVAWKGRLKSNSVKFSIK